MITTKQLHGWQGQRAHDSEGDSLGLVGNTYEDRKTGKPDWLTVSSGLFNRNTHFVPVVGASERGGHIKLAYDKSKIRSAPKVADKGALTPTDETTLRAHYGVTAEDFGYGVDDGREGGDKADADREQRADDDRREARQAAKNLKRPGDDAIAADGKPLRPDR